MSTDRIIRRTVTALVKGATLKMGAKGEYLDIQVLRDGMKYPEIFKCWDSKQLEGLISQPNTRHSLILERGKVKPDKDDDGKWASYWWDCVGEAGIDEEDSNILAINKAPASNLRATTDVPPWSDDPALHHRNDDHHDPCQASIERQCAFQQAVNFVMASDPENHNTEAEVIAAVARLTEAFIAIIAEPSRIHFCQEHQTSRRPQYSASGSDVWVHLLPGGRLCIEPERGAP